MILYRLLTSILFPALRLRRLLPGGAVWAERLTAPPARGTSHSGDAPLYWLHGASNGELGAARALITRLADEIPGTGLIITTNSLTARAMVRDWRLPRTEVRLAPFDHRPLVRRFLAATRPRALIMIENELWPNRLTECAAQGLPILVLGGRLSAKSARFWARLPGLSARLMAALRWVAPQDEASRQRFLDLGLPPDRLGPTMVLKAAPTRAAAATALPFDRASTLLAASTHEGEEAVILDAFVRLRTDHPDLRLILAPRHPRRAPETAALIAARGLAFGQRSAGQAPDPATPVYLADTMGEMDLWYQAAGLTFVGGSLVPKGGHTPFEPAARGSVILHGPHLENFGPAYAALAAASAALPVADAATLAAALAPLIGDAGAQTRIATAATAALAPFRDEAAELAFFAALGHLAATT